MAAGAPSSSEPGVSAALRIAGVAFYFHSIRLVGANLVWGAGFVVVVGWVLLAASPAPLLLLPLLAPAWLGCARLGALIARDEEVVLSDAWDVVRRHGVAALAMGAILLVVAVGLAANVAIGLGSGGGIGWVFATLAGWGLVALWLAVFPFWALLADPARDAWPMRARIRLVGLLLLARPGRMAALGLVLVVIVAVSTVLFAVLVTIGASFVALLSAVVVLPAADGLTTRAAGFPPLAVRRATADDARMPMTEPATKALPGR